MSFLFDWLSGWWTSLWGGKKANVLFLGLDNAGKTTLLHLLKEGKLLTHEPTRHPGKGAFTVGSVTMSAHDMGGHAAARRLWRSYFADIHGIVFLVDATDHARMNEARDELMGLLTDDQLAAVPILVLGNKIDCTGTALNEGQLTQVLGVRPGKHLCVQMCSVVKRTGYQEGLQWLAGSA